MFGERQLTSQWHINGALYSSARQDFSHTAGISWEPALSDSQSARRGRPHHLWLWKFHSSSQSSEASALCRWLEGAVRAAAAARLARCVLVSLACSNQHLLMAAWPSCNVHMLGRNWEVVVDQGPIVDDTKQEANTLSNLSSCDMLSLYSYM